MFQALGRGVVKRSGKGGDVLDVKVEFIDDRNQTTVRFQTYTVASMEELQKTIASELKALAAAETDAALSAAVVDVLLGSI